MSSQGRLRFAANANKRSPCHNRISRIENMFVDGRLKEKNNEHCDKDSAL